MEHDDRRRAHGLIDAADRCNELADVAELMGDEAGAASFRTQAERRRMQAMAILDDSDDAPR